MGDGPGTVWDPAGNLGCGYLIPHFWQNGLFVFSWARNSQDFKRYEQKTDFFTHFWVLEGSLVAQLVSEVVGNGLETHLLTFGAHRHPLWTILEPFLGHFGTILAPFWAIFSPKWTKNGGSGAQKVVPNGPKWRQDSPKMTRNIVETV